MEHEDPSTELATAIASGDAAGAAALYMADARLLAPAAELIAGRGEIEAYWRTGISLGLSSLQLEPLEIEVLGAAAVEIGRYTVSLEWRIERGMYLVLHRQQSDGSWRRAVDVFNPDGPRAARRFD